LCARLQDQNSREVCTTKWRQRRQPCGRRQARHAGAIDADLGGHIIKQRVARPGQGKRGGFRMLIGIRSDRAIFLFGFAKNERENIDDDQHKTLREIIASWFAADDAKIAKP